MKVVGLGQCSLDYIAYVDGYPREDAKKEASSMVIDGGGPVATALVSLSRLGAKTQFMGVVSDDKAGAEIIRGLRREGVGISGLKQASGGVSQTAFIIVNGRNGSRTIIWRRPVAKLLGMRDVKAPLIRGADLLLIDGLMIEPSLKAAQIARSCNVPVMLDAGRVREGTLDCCRAADYIVGSEEFANGIGATPREALRFLSSFKPSAATITLGSKGSLTWDGRRIFKQKAFKVDAADTTGAGDVFHGGYIWGLLSGWDLRKTVEFASAFAAIKCRGYGGRAGIPGLAATRRFIGRHRGM